LSTASDRVYPEDMLQTMRLEGCPILAW